MADVVQTIEGSNTLKVFWCPGCECAHHFDVSPGRWIWNEDTKKPTVRPSILVHSSPAQGEYKGQPQCHLYITEGELQFLQDCEHGLAGKTVPMEALDGG